MATLPIDYMVAYYGASAWKDLVVRWNGTGTNWTLYQVGVEKPLYTGTEQQYLFTGLPSTEYNFKVTTTVDGKDYDYTVLTYTTALPAPINMRTSSVFPTTAELIWNETDGVDFYEICNVRDSYAIIGQTEDGKTVTYDLTGLAPTTLYSYAVRSVYKEQRSRWSNPATFFTPASDSVTPGVYEFAPLSAYTWRAGRAGSSDPSWAPAQSNWYHGDGLTWGDLNGVQSTYFFFGSNNPFNRLRGATVSKCEIYLSRGQFGGDPGPVLSRVGLHTYPEKPDSQPIPSGSSVDVGTLSRGEAAWFEVPTAWAEQLIIGAYATGWYWGGCQERFQEAKNVDSSVNPRIGMIRITVS
jgi:hypothetical protein